MLPVEAQIRIDHGFASEVQHLVRQTDLQSESEYNVKSPIHDTVQIAPLFCRKAGWLRPGKPWRTVASLGQAGERSRKHRKTISSKGVCGLSWDLG